MSGQHAVAEDRGSLQDGRSPFLQLVLVDREPNMDVFYGGAFIPPVPPSPSGVQITNASDDAQRPTVCPPVDANTDPLTPVITRRRSAGGPGRWTGVL